MTRSPSPPAPRAPQTPQALRAGCARRPIVEEGVILDHADDLRRAVIRQASATGTLGTLNVGGWKSREDVLSWPLEASRALARAIAARVTGSPVAWAMVNVRGSHHPSHRHATSIVSGIYCVDSGHADPGVTTPTIFELDDGNEQRVEQRAGTLTLFPGDLWHRVPRHESDGLRVTIAFDLRR